MNSEHPLNDATAIGGPLEYEEESRSPRLAAGEPDLAKPNTLHQHRHAASELDHDQTDSDITINNPDHNEDHLTLSRASTTRSHTSSQSGHQRATNLTQTESQIDRNGREIISIPLSSPSHPQRWPRKRKHLVFFTGIMTVVNSTLGSSLPANAVPSITAHFNVTNDLQFSLPISCFLMGYVIGPIICGPLSENYGRKPVLLIAFCGFIIWTMCCAIAPNWPALLIFRLLCGVFASAPLAISPGMYADVYGNPRSRGMAMALYMVATTLGPTLAPAISGFVAQTTSWRWVFGVGTFFALFTLPIVIALPESYLPVLVEREAKRMRKETGRDDIVAATSLERKSWLCVMSTVMLRPFRMLFQEAIVACICLYAMLVYSTYYLYFQSYPLIFLGEASVYKFNPGEAGLTFVAILVGSVLGLPIFLWWDRYLQKKQDEGVAWAKQEEYRRLPLACLGGPLFVASLFWLGWSAREDVHWIVPTLSGVPFGIAFLLIFMALLIYLSDAYLTFAASAQGMASTCRSLGGAVLPIAGRRMFLNLGINWACSLLAFLALGVAVIPFVFIRYGEKIRANSKFCQELRRLQEKENMEQTRDEERRRRSETGDGIERDDEKRDRRVVGKV